MTIYNTIAHVRGELLSNTTQKNIVERRERRYVGSVGELNRWVDQLRERTGESIPYFDPDAAAEGARVLMLLQDPSNAADGESGFISLHNNDRTARNVYQSCLDSGLSYRHYLPWNVVPWRVGDGRDLESEARRARPYLLEFLELLDPAPEVVILMGNQALNAWRAAEVGKSNSSFAHLEPPLWCPHPSPKVYNKTNLRTGRLTRDLVTETFAEAAARITQEGGPATVLAGASHHPDTTDGSGANSRSAESGDPAPSHRHMPHQSPTAEQFHIHDLFWTGRDLRIRAGAGTGKTTTLLQLADILSEQGRLGLYIAFNKSIAVEAQRRFPRLVTCSTAHALANRGIRNTRHARLLDKMRTVKRVPFYLTQESLGIRNANVTGYDGRPRQLSAYQLTRHALRTIDDFCKTADDTIGPQHVPIMAGVGATGHQQLIDIVLPHAHRGWADLTNPHGNALTFGHGHYLKLWALEHPRIAHNGDALFLDEAQDTSPVLAGIIAEQDHLQRVVVGDSAQAIYRFTGATSFMTDDAIPGSVEGRLTQSWRFGQAIADEANQLLARLGDDMRLTGNPAMDSRVDRTLTTSDAILTRTNGRALEHVMAGQRAGRKVHLMGDQRYAIAFCADAERLQNGKDASTGDLAMFATWQQVVQYTKDSPDATDWKVLVKLIEEHGVPALRRALERTVDEDQADLVVATVHKAKGREWGHVVLDEDLAAAVDSAAAGDDPAILRDELMLAYVAVTRAQEALNPGRLTGQTPHVGRLSASAPIPGEFVGADRFLDALDRMEGLGTLDEIIENVIEREKIPDSDEIRKQLAAEIDALDGDPRFTWEWFDEQWVAAGGRYPVEETRRRAQLNALATLTVTLPCNVEAQDLAHAIVGTALSHVSTRRLAQLRQEIATEQPNPPTFQDDAPAGTSSPQTAGPEPERVLAETITGHRPEHDSPKQLTPEQEAWAALFPYPPPEPDSEEEEVNSFAQRDTLFQSDPELERVNQRENDPADRPLPVDEEIHSQRRGRLAKHLARTGSAIARHAPDSIRAKWRKRRRLSDDPSSRSDNGGPA
ncbi:UvrD-helicase domain-containing protein [Rhodococcus sp. NCIMB 12038]|uniref:UvrD-helicase domain-containing protein n=1 Tax=Rhodococcus sp. NCIMB 12038 TaxID=933800 RepID=UPI00117AD2F1|nr:UvrD-helicase domain-containing protein [Rhodococcus sp. NCIMB 12038]